MSGYTIGEIVVWLLLAAVLGFVLGWLIRDLKCRSAHHADASVGADVPPTKAAALSATTVETAGFAKSAKPLAGGRAPTAEFVIKGNRDSMLYHSPDSRSYGQTIAEVWFKTEADAIAAGFSKPGAAKKTPAKKAPAKKTPAKKAPAKKTPAKKTPAKKTPAKKAAPITPGRFPRSARPLSGGRPPSAAYQIKGNEDSMIYHSPESPSYTQTIAETWFKTEADAVAAGFRKPRNM